MRRATGLFEQIVTPGNLLGAFLQARKGKASRPEVCRFAADLDANLLRLRARLLSGDCRFEHYDFFTIHDPKERTISVAPFADRVLHHAVMDVCAPIFERAQIYDSYACLPGKGTLAALERAAAFARQFPFYLKLDVRKYFDSLSHERLKALLARLFKEPPLLALLDRVIDGYASAAGCAATGLPLGASRHCGAHELGPLGPCSVASCGRRRCAEPAAGGRHPQEATLRGCRHAGAGVPIGNLTSQYFANHYLSGLDHYAKEVLCAPGYVRYMDDIVVWGQSTRELLRWERALREYCETRLDLDLKSPCLNRSEAGLPFLGFVVFPGTLRLSSRSCRRARRRLKACEEALRRERIEEGAAAAIARSILARTDWTTGAPLRRKLLSRDFGHCPRARTASSSTRRASSAAAVGTTTLATAAARTATGTSRATGTTTSASASFSPPAQGNGRRSWNSSTIKLIADEFPVEPGSDPVPSGPTARRGEAPSGGRVLVARAEARDEGSRPPSPLSPGEETL